MMSLELAKELRNAGFPNIHDLQHRQGRQFLASDDRVSFYSLGELAPPENWFIPTLEELIEACEKKEGYDHFSLEHRQLGWFASIEASRRANLQRVPSGDCRRSRCPLVVGIEETMTRLKQQPR
jgi:hypothetical protein